QLSPDLLGIANLDGYFVRLNPAWERVLGYKVEELLATPYLDFVHPDDRAATIAEGSKLASGIDTISFENRYRASDGSYKWLLWTTAAATEERLLYGAARDITDRKQAEQELCRHAREMELAKQEREKDAIRLSHLVKELEVAKARAEDASAAKA